jgi:hypothetical protein
MQEISAYRKVTALKSLALLLTGVAAQWWFGAMKAFPSREKPLSV